MRYHDENMDGTISSWPCNAWIMRNAGESFIDMSVIAYTLPSGIEPPKHIKAACEALSVRDDYKNVPDAKKALKAAGFIPDPD